MKASGDPDRKRAVRHLRELIDALNDRVPHIERLGEAKIARDAAYEEAMRRLAENHPEDLEARSLYALSILGTTQGVRDFRAFMRAMSATFYPILICNTQGRASGQGLCT